MYAGLIQTGLLVLVAYKYFGSWVSYSRIALVYGVLRRSGRVDITYNTVEREVRRLASMGLVESRIIKTRRGRRIAVFKPTTSLEKYLSDYVNVEQLVRSWLEIVSSQLTKNIKASAETKHGG